MQPKLLSFWIRWRVFIIGAVSSVVFALQEMINKPVEDQHVKVYILAGVVALTSYVASQWRGQGVTVLGTIGSLCYTFATLYQTGNFTWGQFILASMAAIMAAVAPPPKPNTYETNKDIVQAKEVPPVQQVVDDTVLPKSPTQ